MEAHAKLWDLACRCSKPEGTSFTASLLHLNIHQPFFLGFLLPLIHCPGTILASGLLFQFAIMSDMHQLQPISPTPYQLSHILSISEIFANRTELPIPFAYLTL